MIERVKKREVETEEGRKEREKEREREEEMNAWKSLRTTDIF